LRFRPPLLAPTRHCQQPHPPLSQPRRVCQVTPPNLADYNLHQSMNCPSCSAPLADGAAECRSCGVILAKWRRPPERRKPAGAPPPRTPRFGVVAVVGVAGAALLIGAFWFFAIRPRVLALRVASPVSAPKKARTLAPIN